MKRDLWKAEHKCINCNIIMKKKELIVEGIKVRGWECSKCNETILHPEDVQKMFIFNKLKAMHESWLEQMIEKLYGKRCPDYEEGCACCQAWSVYDTIIDESRGKL